MKAAIFEKPHTPLVIDDVDIIDPRPGEVMVRTVCSGVCHSDLHFIEGLIDLPMAAVLGHEAAGVVERVGEGVTYVEPGDHVIMSFIPVCGKCFFCMRGQQNLCAEMTTSPAPVQRLTWKGQPLLQMASVGSFSELMVTAESGVVKIPKEMPMAEAALIGCSVTTGVGAALYTVRVSGGAHTAVIGCGGVGLNVIQGCRLAGASRIIAVDVVPEKLDLATQFGATDTIDARSTDPVEAVIELTGGLGVEYAFEAIGKPDAVTQAFNMIHPGGTAVVVGIMPQDAEVKVPGGAFVQEKKLIGSMYGSAVYREHMPKLVDLFLGGRLDVSSLVSRRLPLEEVNEAFALMKGGKVARSVLDISAV